MASNGLDAFVAGRSSIPIHDECDMLRQWTKSQCPDQESSQWCVERLWYRSPDRGKGDCRKHTGTHAE